MKLHHIAIDWATLTISELPLVFSDDLDITKITQIKLIKDTGLLFVKSSAYSTEEQARLYKYDEAKGFVFVGCPATTFDPVTSSEVANGTPCELRGELVPMLLTNGYIDIYGTK